MESGKKDEEVKHEKIHEKITEEHDNNIEHHAHKIGHHGHAISHHKKKFNVGNVLIALLIVLGIVMIINLLLTFSLNSELKENTKIKNEESKPAKVELALLKNSKCSDCHDISAAVGYIKNLNVNITAERTLEFSSKEGKELISKYKIEKIPTMIITGEIDKFSVQGFVKRENVLVIADSLPPYTNAVTGAIEGRVTAYYLKEPECAKCNDLKALAAQIKSAGVKLYEEKIISIKSDEGRQMIQKYSIGFAPALILSKSAGEYAIINQAWAQIGSKESDGSYVLRQANPPFINLTSGELKGVVNITYLSDKGCAGCYNVSLHKSILTSPQSFAVTLGKEENYDISGDKGKELIAKYNITMVPTIILSNEISAYPSNNVLKQFFAVHKDGSYVFTKVSSTGTYKDLSTGQVVEAQRNEQ